jgi:hypothetical protein
MKLVRRDFLRLGAGAVASGMFQLPHANSVQAQIGMKKGEIPDYFFNQLRAFNVVVASLQASGNDEICQKCIGPEEINPKMVKIIGKKFRKEVQASAIPKDKKEAIFAKLDKWVSTLEGIKLAEKLDCQKTAGNCTIGAKLCLVKGVAALWEKTEPEATG